MMVEALLSRAQNARSNDGALFLLDDRLSFLRFLGLGLGGRLPDATTIRTV